MISYNGTTFAYIGDAAYEILVREYLLLNGITKVDHLHKEAIKYTSAEGQAKAMDAIIEELSEKELSVFKKGRNAKSERKARNASLATYKRATGFESLIGYLYLERNFDRLSELFNLINKTLFDKE